MILFKLFVCFAGVFCGFFANGIFNEIITTRFGKEVFDFYLTMLLVPALCNSICARLVLLKRSYSKEVVFYNSEVPKKLYLLCSIFNMLSMICSFSALFYISYPTQLILKSSKPISIFVFGWLAHKKEYPKYRFLSILLIVIGVMTFMYYQYNMKVDLLSPEKDVRRNFQCGWLLVLISLILDGFLASTQDLMKRDYSIEAHKLMYFTNKYSCFLLGFALLLSNESKSFYAYTKKYPSLLLYTLLSGLTSAFGQNFIYFSIAWFGPLTCSVITTTRKFFNVLLSVFIFSHHMDVKQWISVLLIFLGLSFDIWIQHIL